MPRKKKDPFTRISIGLPTYNNENIIWLALEGLCRQVTTQKWQLIVYECESDIRPILNTYRERLMAAGCDDIVYMRSDVRTPLANKWRAMAHKARGDIFLLQGSDDYPSPERIERTVKAFDDGADWYQMRYHYHYSFTYKRLIKFDMLSADRWLCTGFNMALKTSRLKLINETYQPSGIDFYLYKSVEPKNVVTDETDPSGGVATDGQNTISTKRFNYYIRPKAPFQHTFEKLETIGLPDDVVQMIRETPPGKLVDIGIKLTGIKELSVMSKDFKGRKKGQEYWLDQAVKKYLQFRGVVE